MKLPPTEKNLRVLVIDDLRAIHADFRKILCGESPTGAALATAKATLFGLEETARPAPRFEVDSAYQGQEGLALVARALEEGRPYALLFIDVRMPPGWDGIETVERIWQIAPDAQVVVCTAYSDYTWDQMVERLGHSDRLLILRKPFDAVEVLQLAVALTEKWRLTQQARATISDLESMVMVRSAELTRTLEQLRGSLAERERTEAALRVSEEKFSRAFRLHPDAVSIHRLRDGACLEVNPSFTTITGYTASDMRDGEPLFRNWGLWVEAAARERLDTGLKTEGEVTGVEGPLRRKDGGVIRCVASARAMEIDGEACALTITRDLTVQKRLEEQLAQAMKLQAVGQLAGGIAHDYNNVLTATLLQLGFLLERDDLAPETRHIVRELEKMANRSASLTRQLLAFSRRQVMRKARIELNDVLGNVIKMLRRLLGENIQLDFRCSATPLWIDADVGMIEQVVTNLCVNARDAMKPRGGRLSIHTSAVTVDERATASCPEAYPGRFACFSVTDTGGGMSADALRHLFEPFFTTKNVGEGTGLGLATVYGIAQQHRGWVEVESEVGRGSTFRILLPMVIGEAPEGSAPVAPALRRGSETILIAEDEEVVRQTVALALANRGYRVHMAVDGKQALELWGGRAQEIDLLFSDMVMPNGVTGLELVEHFRRANPRLKVILTSGYSAELNRLGLPGGPGFRYLAKPFEVSTLIDLVRSCLDAKPPPR